MTDGGEQTEYAVVIALMHRSGPVRIGMPLPDIWIGHLVIPCKDSFEMFDVHKALLLKWRQHIESDAKVMHIDQLHMDVNMNEVFAVWIAVDRKIIHHKVFSGWRIEYDW